MAEAIRGGRPRRGVPRTALSGVEDFAPTKIESGENWKRPRGSKGYGRRPRFNRNESESNGNWKRPRGNESCRRKSIRRAEKEREEMQRPTYLIEEDEDEVIGWDDPGTRAADGRGSRQEPSRSCPGGPGKIARASQRPAASSPVRPQSRLPDSVELRPPSGHPELRLRPAGRRETTCEVGITDRTLHRIGDRAFRRLLSSCQHRIHHVRRDRPVD